MLKAILFDLDGTLISSEDYYIEGTYTWLSRIKKDINIKDIYKIVGKDSKETYDYLEYISGIDAKECQINNDNYFMIENPINFKKLLFADVIDTFKVLKQKNIKIAICSMSPYDYIKKFVEECDLNDYVDYYISGVDCKRNKPDPEVYLKALEYLNIKADEALVVEDSTVGIEAGKAAGIKVIARDDSRFELDQTMADVVLEDLRKLLTII